jgi:chemotaxis protein histidine kinase CheA
MDNLLKEIRRVQRRLALQRFLGVLGWCWFASLAAAAVVAAAARLHPLGIVDWQWLAGLLAAGLGAALGWTFWARTPALQAALEIDHRFGLKERVSSTLAMHPADRASVAGQALVADADARLRRIAVSEKFPVRPPRHLLLPLVPALLVLLIFRIPVKETQAVATEPAAQPSLVVKKSVEDLRQKLAELRKQTEEKGGLNDATQILKDLEQGTKELQKEPDREKALVKLNDLGRELEARRQQLGGGSEALKRQLEKVQQVPRGPAEELAKALSKDDFEKAAQALDKLQKQLADSKLDSAKKEELAKQMEQLKQTIDEMAKQAKEDQADLQKRADQLNQAGDPAAASKLEDAIQKLQQQAPQMQALQNLADKLGQCADQMKQGQNAQAAQAMQQALQQMQDMARQQNELKTLEGAMQQLAEARQQMNCEGGNGAGKREGPGMAQAMLAGGDGDGKDGKPGPGGGKGRGDGARPDAKTDGSFFNSRVSQEVRAGAGQVTGLTGGPNLKNQAEAAIQKAAAAIEHGSTDPLSGQRLPKKQSEHAQQYFDSFREGK